MGCVQPKFVPPSGTTDQQVRDLRAAVFSNLDGLFAFHTSAEDARYLADELGGGLDEQDLLELGHFECYAPLERHANGRMPARIQHAARSASRARPDTFLQADAGLRRALRARHLRSGARPPGVDRAPPWRTPQGA
jgi:hypothetical protein